MAIFNFYNEELVYIQGLTEGERVNMTARRRFLKNFERTITVAEKANSAIADFYKGIKAKTERLTDEEWVDLMKMRPFSDVSDIPEKEDEAVRYALNLDEASGMHRFYTLIKLMEERGASISRANGDKEYPWEREGVVSEELEDILTQIEIRGRMRFFPPATQAEIDAFEAGNGIRFPAQYREWLLFSDGGHLFLPAGVQFYGVAHKPFLEAGDNDRPDDSYIVIGRMSFGDPIICEKVGESISIYNHEAGRIEEDEIFPDFFDFLRNLADEILRVDEW